MCIHCIFTKMQGHFPSLPPILLPRKFLSHALSQQFVLQLAAMMLKVMWYQLKEHSVIATRSLALEYSRVVEKMRITSLSSHICINTIHNLKIISKQKILCVAVITISQFSVIHIQSSSAVHLLYTAVIHGPLKCIHITKLAKATKCTLATQLHSWVLRTSNSNCKVVSSCASKQQSQQGRHDFAHALCIQRNSNMAPVLQFPYIRTVKSHEFSGVLVR